MGLIVVSHLLCLLQLHVDARPEEALDPGLLVLPDLHRQLRLGLEFENLQQARRSAVVQIETASSPVDL